MERHAILGFGESGQAVSRFLTQRGIPFVVYEGQEKLPQLRVAFPHVTFLPTGSKIGEAVLWRSPGIRPDRRDIQESLASGSSLTSEIEMFCRLCPCPVLGVTGSDGKTTTATMAHCLLEAMGKRAWLGGNIGVCLLPHLQEIAPTDTVVLECSSFQLMTFDVPVAGALLTNLTDNHLDWHHTKWEYVGAKYHLLSHARRVVQNKSHPLWEGESLWYSAQEEANYSIHDNAMWHESIKLCELSRMRLSGRHNQENLLGAACLAEASPDVVGQVAETFSGVPHRMSRLGVWRGVLYIDSSIDTTPSRSSVTLASISRPVVAICGGHPKVEDNTPLAVALARYARYVVFTGESGISMMDALLQTSGSIPTCCYIPTFEGAVQKAMEEARAGDAVVLTPAATSFDCFSSYGERGDAFSRMVEAWHTH